MHEKSLSECYTILFYAAFGQFDFVILNDFGSFGYYFATGFFRYLLDHQHRTILEPVHLNGRQALRGIF
jgi:hypothetical protein